MQKQKNLFKQFINAYESFKYILQELTTLISKVAQNNNITLDPIPSYPLKEDNLYKEIQQSIHKLSEMILNPSPPFKLKLQKKFSCGPQNTITSFLSFEDNKIAVGTILGSLWLYSFQTKPNYSFDQLDFVETTNPKCLQQARDCNITTLCYIKKLKTLLAGSQTKKIFVYKVNVGLSQSKVLSRHEYGIIDIIEVNNPFVFSSDGYNIFIWNTQRWYYDRTITNNEFQCKSLLYIKANNSVVVSWTYSNYGYLRFYDNQRNRIKQLNGICTFYRRGLIEIPNQDKIAVMFGEDKNKNKSTSIIIIDINSYTVVNKIENIETVPEPSMGPSLMILNKALLLNSLGQIIQIDLDDCKVVNVIKEENEFQGIGLYLICNEMYMLADSVEKKGNTISDLKKLSFFQIEFDDDIEINDDNGKNDDENYRNNDDDNGKNDGENYRNNDDDENYRNNDDDNGNNNNDDNGNNNNDDNGNNNNDDNGNNNNDDDGNNNNDNNGNSDNDENDESENSDDKSNGSGNNNDTNRNNNNDDENDRNNNDGNDGNNYDNADDNNNNLNDNNEGIYNDWNTENQEEIDEDIIIEEDKENETDLNILYTTYSQFYQNNSKNIY